MTQTGDGFDVDVPALKAAVERMKEIYQDANTQLRRANTLIYGELTAQDRTTLTAKQRIQDRTTGPEGSLMAATQNIQKSLQDKIEKYEAVIAEYERTDQDAAPPSSLPGVGRRT